MQKHLILGIDEVGRGPWAGPLVMGGCILPEHTEETSETMWINSLTDSKKLPPKGREFLAEMIKEKALGVATGWVMIEELNQIGLAAGLKLACRRVVENIQKQKISFQEIVIDGPQNFLAGTKMEKFVTNLNKADLLVKEVSAASIVAKVERDNYMKELALKYPEYGFERHVGYGTALHQEMLKKYGVTPEHRTFVRPIARMLEESGKEPAQMVKKKNTTAIGNKGETAVAKYLARQGHRILERNFKNRYAEIDIVSEKEGRIYFTEVKYRAKNLYGDGLDAVTAAKQKQMKFAAQMYLQDHPEYKVASLAAAAVSGVDFKVDTWIEIE